MNTIQFQLNERQLADLLALVNHGINDLATEYDLNPEDERVMRLYNEGSDEVLEALTSTKSYLWSSGCGRIELEVPADAVDEIAQQGDNEPACRKWLDTRSYLTKQLDSMELAYARSYLTECGIDEVDEKPDYDVKMYVLWVACHDIDEERNQEN